MKEENQENNWAMRAEEVRRMLGGIGKNTLYEWVNQDLIPYKRVARILLFPRKRIQEWLDNNENKRR